MLMEMNSKRLNDGELQAIVKAAGKISKILAALPLFAQLVAVEVDHWAKQWYEK